MTCSVDRAGKQYDCLGFSISGGVDAGADVDKDGNCDLRPRVAISSGKTPSKDLEVEKTVDHLTRD